MPKYRFSRSVRTQNIRSHTGFGLRPANPSSGKANQPRQVGPVKAGQVVYNSHRWRKLARDVRFQRGNRCEKCGCAERLSVNHKIPLWQMGDHPERNPLAWNKANLELLCLDCHAEIDAAIRSVQRKQQVEQRKVREGQNLADQLDWIDG